MAEYLCEEDMSTGEYISRDLALRQLNATCLATDCNNYNGVRCRACAYADAMDFIDAIPAAGVQPVKHGHWIISSDGYYPYCSECKARPEGKPTKFCGECGARMDGEQNEKEIRDITNAV